MQKQLDEMAKQLKEQKLLASKNLSTGTGTEDVEMVEDDKTQKANAETELKRYEKLQAEYASDEHLSTYASQKVLEFRELLKGLANKHANPEEVYLNDIKVEKKMLQEAQAEADVVFKKLKKVREDIKSKEARKAAIDQSIEKQKEAETALAEEFEAAKAKIESFRVVQVKTDTASPLPPAASAEPGGSGRAHAEPVSFEHFVAGANHYLAEADKHLNPEGTARLKGAVDTLHEILRDIPALLARLPGCEEADDDVFDESELAEANLAAEKAMEDAKEGANRPAVGRHAFHSSLLKVKRNKVHAKFTKSPQRG